MTGQDADQPILLMHQQPTVFGKGIKGLRSSYPGDLYAHVSVETPVKLTEHQRKLLKELDEALKKGGEKHSPNAKSWTDRVKDLFK